MKQCIFNENKQCNNCGECDTCVFDKKKTCDNCGKCLELEGYDMKSVQIDKVIESQQDSKEVEIDLGDFSDFDLGEEEELLDEDFEESFEEDDDLPYVDVMDDENNWDYIDDIEGISELVDDISSSDEMVEKFPGLYVYKKK